MTRLHPLLGALALLCLSCAPCTPAAAQPTELTITEVSVTLVYGQRPDGQPWWDQGIHATVFDPQGGENVSRFEATTPEGQVIVKTPAGPDPRWWDVQGNYAHAEWWSHGRPTPPLTGFYEIAFETADGGSVTYTTHHETQLPPEDVPSITRPLNGAVLADTQPIVCWQSAAQCSPYDMNNWTVWVYGPPDERISEFDPAVWATYHMPPTQSSIRFNDDGTAAVPELTPGASYYVCVAQSHEITEEPATQSDPYEHYGHMQCQDADFTIASSSLTSFEGERYPWAGFAAGPGEAAIWREAFTPQGAHSATFAPVADVTGQGISGLKLDLPVGPSEPAGCSLRGWVYVDERTAGDSSSFFGFIFSDDYPDSTTGWSQAVGWEVLSDTESRFQLLGASQPAPVGLPADGWHLVRVNYHRANDALRVWLDGVLIGDVVAAGAAGAAPHQALLGALGESGTARHLLRLDDVSITPMLDVEWPEDSHLFGRVEGLEQVVEGQQYAYTLRYGLGYPALGMDPLTEEQGSAMYVGVTLPPGYSYVSADPLPDRVVGETMVWERFTPVFGQQGYLYLEAQTPTGLPAASTETLYLWVTDDPGAAAANPPNPANWTSPCDGTWSCPQDVLPQLICPAEEALPDVWVRKDGPRYASPGDTIYYAITVGNRGLAPATDVVVRDQLPELLGNGDRIVGNLELASGETWTGVLSEELPWGVAHGTLLLNLAYVPSCPAEVNLGNNESLKQTTTLAAHDPNAISVSPEGGVDRGDTLTYTLECENTGSGTAYGVYVTMVLDSQLGAATLSLPPGPTYEPGSRTILWNVATLAAGAGASMSFDVQVAADGRRARPIIGHATVYFPSVPEETPTNIVVNYVLGSFPDVAWDHWGLLDIERIYEAGLTVGYPNGTYQPQIAVSRAQMAIYIARALAGGDTNIPTGPVTPTFPDVTPDPGDPYHVCYDHVEYVVDNEIVVGYPDNLYHPSDPVDRGQMAIFVSRAAAGGDEKVPSGPATPTFPDVTRDPADPYHVCYDHIEYAVSYGIVAGYPDGRYRPDYVVTRGLMAIYLARAFQLPM